MARRLLTIEEMLAMLAELPPRIAALTAGREPPALQARPAPGEWPANDVLAHLRACADVWGDCIATILAEDHPTIRAINPGAWIARTDYPEWEFHASLRAFAAQRADLLAVLSALSRDDWSRVATVTGAGAPLQRSVNDYAQRLARHEQPHITQIARIVDALSEKE